MLSKVKLDWFRREIARLAGSKEAAEEAAFELFATDWKEVILKDKVKCTKCGAAILYHGAEFFSDHFSSKKVPYCNDCSAQLYERECFSKKCKNRFITNIAEGRLFCSTCHKGKEELCYLGICAVCNGFCPRELGICYSCMPKRGIDKVWLRKEYIKVQTHKENAVWKDLKGELTITQWIGTLEYFNWRCAYCLIAPYEHLEHFVPLSQGGDTTKSNCVPSCKECNGIKGQTHPDQISTIPLDSLNRVRTYLAQF